MGYDEYRIVTNRFWDNWFILGDFGGHAYAGDYGSVGDFNGLLSPDFNVGIGKWFTPGIGAKIQFGLSNSKGYSKEETYFTYGDPMIGWFALLEIEKQVVGLEHQCDV